MKRCPRCGETLPLDAFSVDPRRGTPRGWCRACEAAARRERYAASPDVRARAIERAMAYQAKHREELAAKKREWEKANAEKRRQQRRARKQI